MLRRPPPMLMTALLVLTWGIAFAATHCPMTPISGPFPHADKVVHGVIYAVLAFAVAATAISWKIRWSAKLVITIWLLLAVAAILDEVTQLLVRGRSADPKDWLADCVGATIGLAAFAAVRAWYRSKRRAAVRNEARGTHEIR